MNWEMFAAVITWCVTIVAAFAGFAGIMIGVQPDLIECQRKPTLIIGVVASCLFVLGLATIGGMGWYV